MADELFDALEEARRGGGTPQNHFAELLVGAAERIDDTNVRCGFLCGVNDRLNLLLGFAMEPAPWQTPETWRRLCRQKVAIGQGSESRAAA